MAWGRRNSNPPPPPKAFSDSMEQYILRHINATGLRLQVMYMQQFTFEELKLLFIDPEDRSPLTHAYNRVRGNNIQTQQLFVNSPNGNCRIRFRWDWRATDCDGSFFVPKSWGGQPSRPVVPRDDAPKELLDRYNDMAENLERTSREWGLVGYVFDQLNQNGYCNTPPQMRYVWPALPQILRYSGYHNEARQVAEASSRAGDKAKIPHTAAPYIRETYDIVTRSLMFDDLYKKSAVCDFFPPVDVTHAKFTVKSSTGEVNEIAGAQ